MILFSLSISLFDSLSTTQQIIIFVLILTTAKPLKNALCYLGGLTGAYFTCGIAGYLALDQIRFYLAKLTPSMAKFSDPHYYQSEFLTGLLMVIAGIWYFQKKKHTRPGKTQNVVLKRLQTMNSIMAFGIGVFISVTSFPLSVPYIVALGKYSAHHPGIHELIGYILVYNIGYALPMLAVLIIYLIASRGTNDLNDTLHDKARLLNLQLTTWTLAGFGIFSMVDASCYFVIGHALIKGRFF